VSRAAVVSTLSSEQQWRVVLARDRAFDGAFVYAVRSTGIYCRPSCPSRKPGRDQVTFYAAPEPAERAGFRPCRRCRPGDVAQADPRAATVRRACQVIDSTLGESTGVSALARAVGTTPARLASAFRGVLGVSPRQYRDQRRLDVFKRRLKEGRRVSPALYDAGYSSTSRVYEHADRQLGMTPATYRNGGRGAHIRYATASCPVGWLLVAATDRGICRVALGSDRAVLERALRAEFPAAHVAGTKDALAPWVRALVQHLQGTQPRLDLPLDVQATAFQRRVWDELRKIPYGATRSYAAVARAIGRPRASRAVARACASNPTALVVPCHRVVREDGALGGYRWGVERKEALLEREAGR